MEYSLLNQIANLAKNARYHFDNDDKGAGHVVLIRITNLFERHADETQEVYPAGLMISRALTADATGDVRERDENLDAAIRELTDPEPSPSDQVLADMG